MARRTGLLVAALASALISVLGAPGAGAAVTDQTVSTPDFTVTFSIPDVAFDGPGCVEVPVANTYTKTGDRPQYTSARLALYANQEGASNGISIGLNATTGMPVTATATPTMRVCPQQINLDRGPLIISGTLTSTVLSGATSEAAVPLASVGLLPNPVAITRPKAKKTGDIVESVWVAGRATARTLTKGVVPAGGRLTLQVKKPGSKVWVSGDTARTDNYGEYVFRLTPASKYPKGTRYRVAVSNCGWCANATSPIGRR